MTDPNLIGMMLLPSLAALVVLGVFTYLYRQSQQRFFRCWQVAWTLYCGYFATRWFGLAEPDSPLRIWIGKMLFLGVAMGIFASVRMLRGRWRHEWYDSAIVIGGAVWAAFVAHAEAAHSDLLIRAGRLEIPLIDVNLGCAVLLLASALLFFRHSLQRNSLAFRIVAAGLALWAVLLSLGQMHHVLGGVAESLGNSLGLLPQLLLAVALSLVLLEDERRSVHDNLLAFSTLDVDAGRSLTSEELAPSMERMLDRLLGMMKLERGALCVGSEYRNLLPSCYRGLSDEWLGVLRACGGPEALASMVYRRGGLAIFRDADELLSAMPAVTMDLRERLLKVMARDAIASVTAISVQSATHPLGVLLLPRRERNHVSSLQTKLLMGLAMQIGMTLDNYLLMRDAQRRTKEYELLTQIGQVISAHLDSGEILRAIHRELGQLFDNDNFYVAFVDEKEVRYELEVEGGKVQPKRVRKPVNGLTEHLVRSGKPMLITSGMDAARAQLNVVPTGKAARCYCGVPIHIGGRTTGVMAVLSYDRDYAFDERHLGIMQIAAGQLAVAIENARLFSEEQQRAKYLGFLNSISTSAISNQDADQMLAGIVAEIQKNFNFDHIGIGLVEYASKEIEIKAEAGTTARTLGRRIPLGVGIIGRVARSGDMALVQNPGENLVGIFSESRSVLCMPMTYGETLLGVLNVESMKPAAFAPQDVLILRTLADLLATALHNAFIFQKMQQQSMTDGLTAIKTRRYFVEAVQAEWKRASRTGRPFSVVLIDLDKFKDVNDIHGHLEGDLVLARVGRLLEQKCRQSNVVARYGGDEFVILMPETGVEQAQALAERLRLWIATDPTLNERKISGSFGVATFPVHGATVEEIIRVADAGMYVSKHAGGNRVSTAHQLVEAETASHDQLVRSYVEGFLHREQTGVESADELVSKLRRLGESLGDGSQHVMREAVGILNQAAEAREKRAQGHGEMVARYAEIIARALNLAEDEVNDLVFAARVHDVGKIVVEEAILNKPAELTPEEYGTMKLHSTFGGEIVGSIPGGSRLRRTVRHHHECFDGSGYPDKLRGEGIPVTARIIAVADSFADMTLEKSFGRVLSPEEALAELERKSGTQFDGMIVRVLARQLRQQRSATHSV